MLMTVCACKKDVQHQGVPEILVAYSNDASTNLLANGDFSRWNTDSRHLTDWGMTSAQGIITAQKNGGLQFSGNTSDASYIYQRVTIDDDRFYMASINADYSIHNYFSCGLYIMDSSLHTVLGKFERTSSDGQEETWKVIFRTKTKGQVAIVLGFPGGINATATFHNASLEAYDYQPEINGSPLAMHLSQKFPLLFSATQFDSTVCKIADYVNSVLLCRYTYLSDTAELPILDSLIGSDPHYAYFNLYRGMVDQLPVAYCQKSSLSLADILTNEFHVPTRQVHMVFGDTGKHQFTEYWDPFAEKWIAIDPCFNAHYIRNGILEGVADLDRTEAPDLIQSFGIYVFHSFLPYDLSWYWKNMDELQITDHYSMTFPYSP